MTPIRFFTDEDVYGQVAVQLRAAGFDALSTPEASRLGQSDADQRHGRLGRGGPC